MPVTPEQARWFADAFGQLVDHLDQAILGKKDRLRLVLTALLSDGHVLLERLPRLRLDPARPPEIRGLVFRKPPELQVRFD